MESLMIYGAMEYKKLPDPSTIHNGVVLKIRFMIKKAQYVGIQFL
jgi:hypothetical protein